MFKRNKCIKSLILITRVVFTFLRKYMRNLPKSILKVKSNRACIAYAALEYNENALHNAPYKAKTYKYKWKDIDCKTKAPFICQYNPGLN